MPDPPHQGLQSQYLGNPFDEDLKSLAADFGILLRKVVTTIDRHGLKCKHLGCHKKEVNLFFEAICNREYRSEVARGYQKRLEKYREKLFTFIDHDGVPWNNNNAEHAIKKFAHYREIADGVVPERCLRDYLTLLSIHQTCFIGGSVSFGFYCPRNGTSTHFPAGDISRARSNHSTFTQKDSFRPIANANILTIPNCLTVTDFGGLDVGIPQAMQRSIDFAANSHGIGAG